MNTHIKIFIEQLRILPSTVYVYKNHINIFLQWLELNNINWQQIKEEDAIMYYKYLYQQELSYQTIEGRINVLKNFYNYLSDNGYCGNVFKTIKIKRIKNTNKKEPKITQNILSNIKALKSPKDKLIIYLLFQKGLRMKEVVNIKKSDIDMIGRNMLININDICGKSYKVKINPDYKKILQTHILNLNNTDYMFVSESNRNKYSQLNTKTILRVINKIF